MRNIYASLYFLLSMRNICAHLRNIVLLPQCAIYAQNCTPPQCARFAQDCTSLPNAQYMKVEFSWLGDLKNISTPGFLKKSCYKLDGSWQLNNFVKGLFCSG